MAPVLCSDLEQALDEPRLSHCIISADPFHLTFPHHVCRLDAFDRSLRGVERAEALSALATSAGLIGGPAPRCWSGILSA